MEFIETIRLKKETYDEMVNELNDRDLLRIKVIDLTKKNNNLRDYIINEMLASNSYYFEKNFTLEELKKETFYGLSDVYRKCKELGFDIDYVKCMVEDYYNEVNGIEYDANDFETLEEAPANE